jgi:very-short-patch-repair endonuclease/predicted transcriptional regulator of viral defense system
VAVAALAGRQHGVVGLRQLLALGLSKNAISRRVATGGLHRLHRGVYAAGHIALTPRSRHLAAVLACGQGALLSHRSAAWLWGVLRFSSKIEVTAVRPKVDRDGVTVHRSRRIHAADRAVVDAIPVTSVARTLVDLADVLSEARLADAVHEAEVLRLFDLRALEETLARVGGRRGRHRLRRILADWVDDPTFTRSEAERLLLDLIRTYGLPTPQVNVWVAGYEVDFFWPEANLVVELDGAATHHTRRAFHRDRERDRDLASHGIQVVRVTSRDLKADGPALARQLAAILAQRK